LGLLGQVYTASSAGSLTNHGERFRAGECISSYLAGFTVNAATGKRCAKPQQIGARPAPGMAMR
jgi:hypothetical protein